MATSLEKLKKLYCVFKPFHLSTNPEILASEPAGLRRRPLKNIFKNKEKNIGKIYSTSGKFAERAKNIYIQTSEQDTQKINS